MTTQRLPLDVNFESNPFRPDLPAAIDRLQPELREFLYDLSQTLRNQHNQYLAGDTTFPWEHLTDLFPTPLYHVGAVGRFLHPTYGLMRARFVRFSQPEREVEDTGVVVGHVPSQNGFSWQATTRFANSSETMAMGLLGAYRQPDRNEYGWVVIEGVNHQSLTFFGLSKPVVGTRIVWRDSSTVTERDYGTVIGRVMSTTGITELDAAHWLIPPGCIQLTAWEQGPDATDGDDTVVLTPDQLEDVAEAVAVLLSLASVSADISRMAGDLTALRNSLTAESQTRSASVRGLQDADLAFDAALASTNEQLAALAATLESTEQNLELQLAALSGNLLNQLSGINGRLNANQTVDGQQDQRLNLLEAAISAPPVVQVPVLNDSWEDYGAPYQPVAFSRDSFRQVTLTGAIKNEEAVPVTSLTLFTLPAGYRPAGTHVFIARCEDGVYEISVNAAGEVNLLDAAPGLSFLFGVTFRAV